MTTNKAEEAPLGFAGDVDGGGTSFRLSSSPSPSDSGSPNSYSSSGGSVAPVQVERLPPPSLQDPGLVGGGVLLEGVEAGRSLVSWRAQESGLWLEERGLDDDLEGGGLHLRLQGGVSTPGAVGIFGSEGGDVDQSAMAVCAYTDDGMVHRVLLQRPTAPPGDKAPSALSAMMTPQARTVTRLGCSSGGEGSNNGASCWINRHLLVVGGADGSMHCARIVEGVDGQGQKAVTLSEETLRAKTGWNPLSGGGGGSARAVAVTGFWREEENRAVILSLHTDWSFRVWTTTQLGARRGGGLVNTVDARQFLGQSHHHQTAAMHGNGCFLSAVAVTEASGMVVAAVAAEGGLPIHVVLMLPAAGGEVEMRGIFEAPSDAGPLVDAFVNDKLAVWALWARPRGGGGVAGGFGGVSCYGESGFVGEDGRLGAVHHRTIDEWLVAQAQEDGVLDELFRSKGGWAGLVSLRCPPPTPEGRSLGGVGGGGGGSRAVAFAAVELMESFYLRRMFAAGRFGRRALASALREALPQFSDAGPLSSNSTSLQDLQDLALEGVRHIAETAFRTLDGEPDADTMSLTAQQALLDVHRFWKRLMEACVSWGWAEARPLGLAPGGAEEFAAPFVMRAGRTACLVHRGSSGSSAAGRGLLSSPSPSHPYAATTGFDSVSSPSGAGVSGRDRRLCRLRELAAGVPAAFEEALVAGAGDGRVVDVAAVARGGAAAAMFRGFEVESALAREGTAGGLADADNLPRGLEEEGGYKREQTAFLKNVSETLLRSAVGARLAEAAATVLQTDAVRDVLTWVESLKPVTETAQSRPLGHRGGVRGRSAGVATAAAFGTVKLLRDRSEEARNTVVLLMLVLEQIDRVGLAGQLEANIVGDALPLALKCMNQYALAAEIGSHHIRPRAGNPPAAASLGRVGGGSTQPAAAAALKPWGCTALEGLFLDGQGVVQDYWAMVGNANATQRLLGLGGLSVLLAGMCEGTPRSPFDGLDSGGLVAFLHANDQYQLALPLVGLAVEWQWRMKAEPDTTVLTTIARGFLHSAEAAARSEGRGGLSAGPLLDRATKWYVKASQALRASLFRRPASSSSSSSSQGPGFSGAGGGAGDGAESVVRHFEGALEEVERARDRVKGGGGARAGMVVGFGVGAAATQRGGAAEDGAYDLDGNELLEDFGGRGAVNALELARAALAMDRDLRRAEATQGGAAQGQQAVQLRRRQQQHQQHRQARLCQLVFKHASEALSFEEAFGAICDNPVDHQRKENLEALAQHMCDSGRLGELCLLPLEECPSPSPSSISPGGEGSWQHPSQVVKRALWGLALRSNVAEVVSGGADGGGGGGVGGRRRKRRDLAGRKANYFDCLYALYMARGEAVEAARAQDKLRERLEAHPNGSALPFVAAAQRARLAALNALAVAPLPANYHDGHEDGSSPAGGAAEADAVASICPPVGERRLDSAGRPAGVRTAAVMSREAARVSAAMSAAEAAVAVVDEFAALTETEVPDVARRLASHGRYEEAADVVLKGLEDQPRAMFRAMDEVVGNLASACAHAEDVARGYEIPKTMPLGRGVGPLKPRVSATVTGATSRGAEHAASLWPILRQLLRLDSAENGFSYHAVAAKTLLKGMPYSTLPRWLEDSYLGKAQEVQDPPANANAFPPPPPRPLLAPWKAFTSGGGEGGAGGGPNPSSLLDMYVFDGRLEEACLFLSRLLDVDSVEDIGALTELVPEKSGGTDFLPYASIDRLFVLCEASLERSAATAAATTRAEKFGQSEAVSTSGVGNLRRAFETVEERLVQYFKVAKAISAHAQPNRAAATAAAASGSRGGLSNTSAFMLTD